MIISFVTDTVPFISLDFHTKLTRQIQLALLKKNVARQWHGMRLTKLIERDHEASHLSVVEFGLSPISVLYTPHTVCETYTTTWLEQFPGGTSFHRPFHKLLLCNPTLAAGLANHLKLSRNL